MLQRTLSPPSRAEPLDREPLPQVKAKVCLQYIQFQCRDGVETAPTPKTQQAPCLVTQNKVLLLPLRRCVQVYLQPLTQEGLVAEQLLLAHWSSILLCSRVELRMMRGTAPIGTFVWNEW